MPASTRRKSYLRSTTQMFSSGLGSGGLRLCLFITHTAVLTIVSFLPSARMTPVAVVSNLRCS